MCEQKEDVEGRGQDADQLNGGVPGRKESVARPRTEGNSFSRWVIFFFGGSTLFLRRGVKQTAPAGTAGFLHDNGVEHAGQSKHAPPPRNADAHWPGALTLAGKQLQNLTYFTHKMTKIGQQAHPSCQPPVDSTFVYVLVVNDKKMK